MHYISGAILDISVCIIYLVLYWMSVYALFIDCYTGISINALYIRCCMGYLHVHCILGAILGMHCILVAILDIYICIVYQMLY